MNKLTLETEPQRHLRYEWNGRDGRNHGVIMPLPDDEAGPLALAMALDTMAFHLIESDNKDRMKADKLQEQP